MKSKCDDADSESSGDLQGGGYSGYADTRAPLGVSASGVYADNTVQSSLSKPSAADVDSQALVPSQQVSLSHLKQESEQLRQLFEGEIEALESTLVQREEGGFV